MKTQVSNGSVAEVAEVSQAVFPVGVDRYFLQMYLGREIPWNATTIGALVSLVLFWAFRVYSTWAMWGNLSIDSGREMYVPSVLLKGKMLYRDIWYLYGPVAPYFNKYLFQVFGTRMEVLYWAGSLSALACAVLLFLSGKQFYSLIAGWTAGAVVLMQAFQPGLFCFPLAYSFSSVYGCVAACLFLYLAIRSTSSPNWGWLLGAASTAAVALLLKIEFGVACYAVLFLLIVARYLQNRSWIWAIRDLATTVPGILVCGWVIHWMVSIAGTSFITQENMMSWPTSYFMKTFGRMWLERSGFALTIAAFRDAAIRAAFYSALVMEVYCLFWWKRMDPRAHYLRMGLFLVILSYYVFYIGFIPLSLFAAIFFPQDMVFYVAIAAMIAWWSLWRYRGSEGALAVAVLLAFSALLAFRILLRSTVNGYAIYYDGPAVLSFLLLARPLVPRSGRSRRFVFLGESVICLGCLLAVVLASPKINAKSQGYVPLVTDRGKIIVEKRTAESYQAALAVMKTAAQRGEYVLSVPEDTSLYFLSGLDCPTRVFAFTPGIVAPGKMTDELLAELRQKPVQYLIWSNRTFSEYGVAGFGIDFDQRLSSYLKANYHSKELLVPKGVDISRLNFVVWEKNAAEAHP